MTKTQGKNSRVRQVQKRKLSKTGRICKPGLNTRRDIKIGQFLLELGSLNLSQLKLENLKIKWFKDFENLVRGRMN